MQFRPLLDLSLPKLAWIAEIDRDCEIVNLVHGSHVEVHRNFFIEGIWNGPFELGDFGETDCVFGTGGIVYDNSVRFVTSASTTDYLFYSEDGEHVTVSNSLPLLLAYTHDALDTQCRDYPAICDSIMNGIDDYRPIIPTKKGSVRRQMYRNIDVSSNELTQSDKRMPPRFTRFVDYRNYLRANYELMVRNARDTARTRPLAIWSTQSKGYDSTAINAIASEFGIDKVFTVPEAKSNSYLANNDNGELPDDDGGEICNLLGLNCIRINRRAFAESFDDECLYYCALHQNQDVNLKEISKHISQAGVLLTGTLGEIWYSRSCLGDRAFLDSTMKRWDLGGHGMSELRLVTGFVHLPMPYIGARRKEDIVAITMSPEMDPWRLKNMYDRPIPRRIAEEAGIPREAFGQSKMGSVLIFPLPSVPYGKKLRHEFFRFLAQAGIMGRFNTFLWPTIRWINSILMLKSERRFALVYYAERVISKLMRKPFQFSLLWSHLDGVLFCFCVNKTALAYSKRLLRLKKSPVHENLDALDQYGKVDCL
jgi:hypothetical protein